MTDQKNRKNEVSPLVVGAVVGAGLIVASAVVLKDKDRRNKVKKVLSNAKVQIDTHLEEMQKQAKVKKDEVAKSIADGKEEIKKAAENAKESLDKSIE